MIFDNSIYYHIYNRGVDKRRVFLNNKDFERFLLSMVEFNQVGLVGSLRDVLRFQSSDYWNSSSRRTGMDQNDDKLVKIIAYCLLPNHFHLILQQLTEGGISKFLQKLMMGYTRYFNIRYNRSGVLFQGKTKSKPIDNDEYLIWLSAYINTNAEIHKIAKADKYRWSSWSYYTGQDRSYVPLDVSKVLAKFSSKKEYRKYCRKLIPVWQERKEELGKML